VIIFVNKLIFFSIYVAERVETATEANNSGAIVPTKGTLDYNPTNEENCNISSLQKNATHEESVVIKKSLDGYFKLKTEDVLNHSESSAFSR
jgi:hypothetical protein